MYYLLVMKRMTVNLFFIQFILSLSAPYPNRIRAVLAPYILRSKVPLHEESTERVRSRYGFDTSQMLRRYLKPGVSVPYTSLQPGDVFIKGGSPGHAVIVVDVAIYPQTGKTVFLLAQSYMLAQQIHIPVYFQTPLVKCRCFPEVNIVF